MALAVCTWNLFHGRARPPVHADLVGPFAQALAARPWDVCGLQEAPPWWTAQLAAATGASARAARTSLERSLLPRWQERTHRRDPERLGVAGAGANVLLVRPGAGEIVDHRVATLRWCPQRRTVHAVRLRRPGGPGGEGRAAGAGAKPGGPGGGEHWWVANVHTHNKPESKAAADTIRALAIVGSWAGSEPVVLLGDLNLAAPQGLARVEGWEHLHGHRVDHVLGRGVAPAPRGAKGDAGRYADVVHAQDAELSDHRIVGLSVAPA